MKYLSLVRAPEVLNDPKKVVEIIREHVEIINSLTEGLAKQGVEVKFPTDYTRIDGGSEWQHRLTVKANIKEWL